MAIRLGFFGAAQNVTGSCYLVEGPSSRILVDCGFYQERDFKHRNFDPFPFDVESIDAVLLTHAHLDHCGLLPKLVRAGFRGPIWSTAASRDIARIVMLDSAKIQKEDANFKKRRHEKEGRTGPHPPEALYTAEDAESAAGQFKEVKNNEIVEVANGIRASFHIAGHILGSSMIRLEVSDGPESRIIVFSGDIGRWDVPILQNPTIFESADYVICESTYGDREHEKVTNIQDALAEAVTEACKAGGNVIIPSFAIERTQELLYHLNELLAENRIPHLATFVDSPMAIKVTEVFGRHLDLFDEDAARHIKAGDHPCDFPGLIMSRTVSQSKAINHIRGTSIIIAGSGMCTGGRIKHHLAANISRPESTVLFVGYQAVGTLGRQILDGVNPVRILGIPRKVEARITRINGFSGHADRSELIRWLSGFSRPPRKVFLTHGEPDASASLAAYLRDTNKWEVEVPAYRHVAELG